MNLMVSVAQLVEQWTVAPRVAGSTPVAHLFAPVAQLDRAPGFEPVGCAFESRRAHLNFAPLAQLVEHRILNPRAAGSTPARGIVYKNNGGIYDERKKSN